MNDNDLDELSRLATRLQVLDSVLAAYCLLLVMTIAAFIWSVIAGPSIDMFADPRLSVPLNLLVAALPPVVCCFQEMERSHGRVSQILRANSNQNGNPAK